MINPPAGACVVLRILGKFFDGTPLIGEDVAHIVHPLPD